MVRDSLLSTRSPLGPKGPSTQIARSFSIVASSMADAYITPSEDQRTNQVTANDLRSKFSCFACRKRKLKWYENVEILIGRELSRC